MNKNTILFLEDLKVFVEKWKLTIEIEESCNGYAGFSPDGLCFTIPATDWGHDYISVRSTHIDITDIDEAIARETKIMEG